MVEESKEGFRAVIGDFKSHWVTTREVAELIFKIFNKLPKKYFGEVDKYICGRKVSKEFREYVKNNNLKGFFEVYSKNDEFIISLNKLYGDGK